MCGWREPVAADVQGVEVVAVDVFAAGEGGVNGLWRGWGVWLSCATSAVLIASTCGWISMGSRRGW